LKVHNWDEKKIESNCNKKRLFNFSSLEFFLMVSFHQGKLISVQKRQITFSSHYFGSLFVETSLFAFLGTNERQTDIINYFKELKPVSQPASLPDNLCKFIFKQPNNRVIFIICCHHILKHLLLYKTNWLTSVSAGY